MLVNPNHQRSDMARYVELCNQHYFNLTQFTSVFPQKAESVVAASAQWLLTHQWYQKVATLCNRQFVNEGLSMTRSKGYPWWLDVPGEQLVQPTRDSANLDMLSVGEHYYLIVTGGFISLNHRRYMCFDSPIE